MLVQALDRFKIRYLHISTSLLDLSPIHVYHCTLLLIPLQTGAFHSILCDCRYSFQFVLRSSEQLISGSGSWPQREGLLSPAARQIYRRNFPPVGFIQS